MTAGRPNGSLTRTGDVTSRTMMEGILADEEEHRNDVMTALGK